MNAAEDRRLLDCLLAAAAYDAWATAALEAGRLAFYLPESPAGRLVATSAAAALDRADWCYPGPRALGVAVWRGVPAEHIAARLALGAGDPALGHAPAGFLWSGSARIGPPSLVSGATLSQALGAALAVKLRGLSEVALAVVGEAAVAAGALDAVWARAREHALPLVVVCTARLPAWGGRAAAVVSGCALAIRDGVAAAARGVRAGEGPAVLQIEPEGPGMERLAARVEGDVSALRVQAEARVAAAFAAVDAAGPLDPAAAFIALARREPPLLAAQRVAWSRRVGGGR